MASMSKPVTGVAIMMLLEEGKVRLLDPVSKFIPDFKDTNVAMEKPRPSGAVAAAAGRGGQQAPQEIYTVPASREITIRDLMTHTSGLESGGAGSREARGSRRETAPTTWPATFQDSASCRSTSSPERRGDTVRLRASRRWAGSSRSSRE